MNVKRKIFKKEALLYLRVILGAALYAVGIQWFYTPVSMVSGGITGISMIINMLTDLPVGVMILVLNIPIFIIALKQFGLKFMVSSIVGMLATSAFIDLFALIATGPMTLDPILAALFGGAITGLGMGIIYTAEATSGGTDVLATTIRQKYPYINFGTFILAIDIVVVTAYALIFKRFDNAMYTIIAVFVATKVIDTVLYGISRSKFCHIISDRSDDIKCEIVAKLQRGVTIIKGKGAFSGDDKQILMCVVKRQQIVEIRKIVKNIDQKAFVIVTDTRDVFGQGFGDLMSDKKIG